MKIFEEVPSTEELDFLEDGQFALCRVNMDYPIVRASRMNNVSAYFTCPFCYTNYKKDGEPCKTASHVIHSHGASRDGKNYFGLKTAHCHDRNPKGICPRSYIFVITDRTERQ